MQTNHFKMEHSAIFLITQWEHQLIGHIFVSWFDLSSIFPQPFRHRVRNHGKRNLAMMCPCRRWKIEGEIWRKKWFISVLYKNRKWEVLFPGLLKHQDLMNLLMITFWATEETWRTAEVDEGQSTTSILTLRTAKIFIQCFWSSIPQGSSWTLLDKLVFLLLLL